MSQLKASLSRRVRPLYQARDIGPGVAASVITIELIGATRRIRTDDLLITNQLLYQLS